MNTKTPIIAFDIHPTRIGYAVVFRGRPLDWGVTRLRRPALEISKHLCRLTEELCRLWQPAVAIIRNSRRNRQPHSKVIRLALASRGIHVRTVPDQLVRGHGQGLTKHELASDLARRYPELKHLLPRKRRLWEPEDDRMHIFTALRLALLLSPRTVGKPKSKLGRRRNRRDGKPANGAAAARQVVKGDPTPSTMLQRARRVSKYGLRRGYAGRYKLSM